LIDLVFMHHQEW